MRTRAERTRAERAEKGYVHFRPVPRGRFQKVLVHSKSLLSGYQRRLTFNPPHAAGSGTNHNLGPLQFRRPPAFLRSDMLYQFSATILAALGNECAAAGSPLLLGEHGGHYEPDAIDTVTGPVNATLVRRHILSGKPLIIRGGAHEWAARERWLDDSKMKERFGHCPLRVELNRKEPSRRDETHTATDPSQSDHQYLRVSQFVDGYKSKTWYAFDSMPLEMLSDVPLPPEVREPGVLSAMEQIAVWWSAGGTLGSLHYDVIDNLHCQVVGVKEFVLFPPEHTHHLHYAHPSRPIEIPTSPVDVEAVDLEAFPGFHDAAYTSLALAPGDCLVSPFLWHHHVRTPPDARNIAVSFWWSSWLERRLPLPSADVSIEVFAHEFVRERHAFLLRQHALEQGRPAGATRSSSVEAPPPPPLRALFSLQASVNASLDAEAASMALAKRSFGRRSSGARDELEAVASLAELLRRWEEVLGSDSQPEKESVMHGEYFRQGGDPCKARS